MSLAMEVQVYSNAVKDPLAMEGESEGIGFHDQLREIIARGSLDFDSWTSLISEIEKTYPDNIERISLVYDSFLSKFPLCHGYWKKYADHTTRLSTADKVVEIFERAVQSATYSVGLWVDYCSFSMSAFEDPFDIRRLFKRGMSFVGKDYLCHTLWDKYIEFEFSQQQWSFLAHVYIQTLRFPTKKLHRYYDNLKKFAATLEEEMECYESGSVEQQSEALLDRAVTRPEDELSHVIKDLLDLSNGSIRSKALHRYMSIGEHLYQKASRLDGKIHSFENYIQRPYFDVQPVDDNQLENWHRYLDFVEAQEDFDWAVKLYERCLIPCANYPEFWMRYVEFMENKGGHEISNFALDRATQIFLKDVPVIHLFNARFKEQMGDVCGAHAAFHQCDTESNSHFLENVIKEANMEKRLGNLAAASNIYERALKMAVERQKLHTVPVLYVHFYRLKYVVTGSEDAARDVIIDGIQHVPHCRLLLEELIKFTMMHGGSRQLPVVDPIIANAITPGPDVSQGLGSKDREDISCLYLEFVDLCGTIHDVRKAWNRHIKLFPHLISTASFHKHPTPSNQLLNVAMEEKQGNPFPVPSQPSVGHSFDHPTQISVQEQKLPLPKNHTIQPDQGVADQSQPEGSYNIVEEEGMQLCHTVAEQFEEEGAGVNELTHDLVQQSGDDESRTMALTHDLVQQSGDEESRTMALKHDLVQQSGDEASGAMALTHDLVQQSGDEASGAMALTHDLVHRARADGSGPMELTHDLVHQSREVEAGPVESTPDFEQPSEEEPAGLEASRDCSSSINIQQEQDQDHEFEQHQKPVSFGSLSLNSQEKESLDLISMEPYGHDVPQEISTSDGSVLEHNTNGNPSMASPNSPPATDCTPFQNESDDDESISPSLVSPQNPTPTETHLQPDAPVHSVENWNQVNDSITASEGSSYAFHGCSQDQQHKQQPASPRQHCPTAELGAQMHTSQGHPHDPLHWKNPQVQKGTQSQNQYQVGTARVALTTSHAGPVQNVVQQNSISASQSQLSFQSVSHPQVQPQYPVQNSGRLPHTQYNQAYNQMFQFRYQQQQQFLQQQYKQEMLQMQQPHLQKQHQQPYQQQQQHHPPEQQQQNQQQHHYLQQQKQFTQPPYQPQQLQQQQYQLYLQQEQQQTQQQHYQQLSQQMQAQHGQQLQYFQLEEQEREWQLRQHYQLGELAYQQHLQGYQQQTEEGYQLLLQQYQLQQEQGYQRWLQQRQVQQEQGYQQTQQQHHLQSQQHQQHQDEEQQQLEQQITSSQNLTRNRSYYQQGQGIIPAYSTGAPGPSDSPHPQQRSPQVLALPHTASESGSAVSSYHQQLSPNIISPSHGAGTSRPAASPHLGHQFPQNQ